MQVINAALDGCGDAVFDEPFDGDGLSLERWVATLNDAEAGAIAVHDGALHLDVGEAATASFPYLESWVVPFPATGGFRLDVTIQFPDVRTNGATFAVLDAQGGSLVRLTAQFNQPAGLTASIPGAWLTFSQQDATAVHTFHLTFLPAGMFVAIDDENASGPFQVDHRPRTIWMGYPSEGQTYGVDHSESERPSEVNACGRVDSPLATVAPWTPMVVDRIAVIRTDQRPH